jgi:LmbE family N-acetylglucosaminyl deacetylase
MKKRKAVLVVVAHPDDETIWMGGTLLSNKDWNLEIVSLCRKNDKERAKKFYKICKILNAKCSMGNLEDEKLSPIPASEIIKQILNLVKEKQYHYIFTHGKNGEYGHIRHKEVHKAVKKMLKANLLACEKVFSFDYSFKDGKICSRSKSDKLTKLPEDVFKKKKYLIENVYGFSKGSFEERSSNKEETFKI